MGPSHNDSSRARGAVAGACRGPAFARVKAARWALAAAIIGACAGAGIVVPLGHETTPLHRAPRVLSYEPTVLAAPTRTILTSTGEWRLLLGNTTPIVKVAADKMVETRWDGLLMAGSATYGISQTAALNGAVELQSHGELYVRSEPTAAAAQAPSSNPLAFPIVVTNKGIKGGSVGTTWFVWVESAYRSHFVLLGDTDSVAPGSPAGPLFVGTCDVGYETGPSGCYQRIAATDMYVTVTHSPTAGVAPVISAPATLPASGTLRTKVDEAKQRAKTVGLRE